MSPRTSFLFIALAVCCFAANYASAMESPFLKCRCPKTSSSYISQRLCKSIEIIPAGARCRRIEILITMRTGQTVCVDPKAPWVIKTIERLTAGRTTIKKA
ncbi:interleukin-8-like isoform X2 [Megalops cyprinoides]|uniref:interleukin-8-like isoform X2 n=1 Tax=Megalops cyprinoides TaxID=118141 RepID=UPI001864C7D5|nr:interleukin-8-like isoform X2 [Megalops cyprinoides]